MIYLNRKIVTKLMILNKIRNLEYNDDDNSLKKKNELIVYLF